MIRRTERGWAGHFICADRCRFRRNTLLEDNKYKIIVSTVGNMTSMNEKTTDTVGLDRYYETMVFIGKDDGVYIDIDVSKRVPFDSEWRINEYKSEGIDNKANDMHEKVVDEITRQMETGTISISEY